MEGERGMGKVGLVGGEVEEAGGERIVLEEVGVDGGRNEGVG